MVVALLFLGAAVMLGPTPAGASCVGPRITVEPTAAAPGDAVEIHGQYFGTDCNDTGGSGPVLGEPRTDIRLQVVQQDVATQITHVDANADYEFAVRVALPANLQPGPATIGWADPESFGAKTMIDVTAAPTPVAETSPPTVLTPAVFDDPSGSNDRPWLIWGSGLAAVVVLAAAVIVMYRRRTPLSRG